MIIEYSVANQQRTALMSAYEVVLFVTSCYFPIILFIVIMFKIWEMLIASRYMHSLSA